MASSSWLSHFRAQAGLVVRRAFNLLITRRLPRSPFSTEAEREQRSFHRLENRLGTSLHFSRRTKKGPLLLV